MSDAIDKLQDLWFAWDQGSMIGMADTINAIRPALDEMVKARAEIARLTAELAAVRAVPADVEAALDTWAQSEIFAAESEYEPRDSARADANRDILRAAIAEDKARAVAESTDGAVRAERFADTVCSLVGARDHGHGGQTVEAGTARMYADAVVRIGAMNARDKARPTPDEARRLVDALESRAAIAAGHMADYNESDLDDARTALLRALGVEA